MRDVSSVPFATFALACAVSTLSAFGALTGCASDGGNAPGGASSGSGGGSSSSTSGGAATNSGGVTGSSGSPGMGGSSLPGNGGSTSPGAGGGTSPGVGGSTSPGAGGSATAGTTANAGGASTTAGSAGTSASGAGSGTGSGLNVGGKCFPPCAFPEVTDPDPKTGAKDGYGWEKQQACIDPKSTAAAGATACEPPAPPVPPTPGSGGVYTGDGCHAFCSSTLTDPDAMGVSDGWGYEHGHSCIVPGTAAAYGGVSCDPMLPPLGTGDGVQINDENGMPVCHPLCRDPVAAMPDANGWGWEYDRNCILSASVAALQGVPCDGPDPPTPPPVPPAPPGNDWNADYTATMFGQADCQPFGFSDATNLSQSTCIGSGKLALNADNDTWFGATGDLSTLWGSGAACTCIGGANSDRCGSPPACSGQTNCGQCVEVVCNATGKNSYMNDGFTHNEFCKANASVVVQLIDACPHNHPNNTYWCTTARKNHIDVSCSAFNSLVTLPANKKIGEIGSINVYARSVPCSTGLGTHGF